MPTNSCVDPEVLEKLQKIGGEKLLQKMVNLFLEHTPGKIEQIVDGGKNNDLKIIADSAHSLLSSSGNLGAVILYSHAKQLETALRNNENQEIAAIIDSLVISYHEVKTFFEQMKDGFNK